MVGISDRDDPDRAVPSRRARQTCQSCRKKAPGVRLCFPTSVQASALEEWSGAKLCPHTGPADRSLQQQGRADWWLPQLASGDANVSGCAGSEPENVGRHAHG